MGPQPSPIFFLQQPELDRPRTVLHHDLVVEEHGWLEHDPVQVDAGLDSLLSSCVSMLTRSPKVSSLRLCFLNSYDFLLSILTFSGLRHAFCRKRSV